MNTELRFCPDRRKRPTPMFSRYTFFGGRRRGARRAGDARAIYVDQIGGGIMSLVLLIFLFHCLDAVFTLAHLSRGGKELNPFMESLIRVGPLAFVAVKLGLAAIGLVFLAVH